MRASRVTSFLILFLLVVPLALASGEARLPVATVEVVDNHPASCSTEVAGFCEVEANLAPTDPGPGSVDASEEPDYFGFATNGSAFGDAWLLPDKSLYVHGNDLYLQDPLIPLVTNAYNAYVPDYPGRDEAGIELSSAGIAVHTPAVPGDPTGYLGPTHGVQYADNGIGYDQEGPFDESASNDTDAYLAHEDLACRVLDDPRCDQEAAALEQERLALTPDVRFGFKLADAQVATNDSLLEPPEGALLGAPQPLNALPVLAAPFAPETIRTPGAGPAPALPAAAPLAGPAPAGPVAPPRAPPREAAPLVSTFGRVAPQAASPVILVLGLGASLLVQVAFSLYSRFTTKESVLRSDARRRIYEAVEARPGISLAELSRATALARNAVSHHLHKLQSFGLVRTRREERRLFVFPMHAPEACAPPADRLPGGCILQALERHGGALPRAALHELLAEIPRRTRNHSLRRLEARGLVRTAPGDAGEAWVHLRPR